MQLVLLKRFTKLDIINLRGSTAKKVAPLSFSILILPESAPNHHFTSCQDFPHQNFKKSIKIATISGNNERIIRSDLKPEVDASLNITCRKVMITYCITKSYQFKIFDSLVLKLQDTETGILKPHYIHLYTKCSVRSFD